MDRMDFLKTVDIFTQLDSGELKKLANIIQEKEYPEGETIFKESEPGDKVYIVQAGEVKIRKSLPAEAEKEEVRLARFKEGEIFGELSIFDEKPRSASAIASREAKLLVITKQDLDRLLDEDKGLGIKILLQIIRKISSRLRMTDESIGSLTEFLRKVNSLF